MIYLLLILAALFYSKTIFFGYVSDDVGVNENKTPKGILHNLKNQLLGLEYYFPKTEHSITLVLFLCVPLLMYYVFGRNSIALLAACLFVFNPANVQGGLWLSGKGYLYSGILVLLAVMFKFILPLAYLASLNFGVSAMFMPLLSGEFNLLYALVIPIWLLLFFKKNSSNKEAAERGMSQYHSGFGFRRLPVVVKTFAYYLAFCLLPRRLGMYHVFLYNFGIYKEDSEKWNSLDAYFWLSLGAIAITGFIIYFDLFSMRYGLLWFVSCISIYCNFIPMYQQPIAERYVFVANIGLMLAVANLLFLFPYLAVGLVVYYATRNWLNLESYRNDKNLIAYNISDINFRNSFFAWMLKGCLERENEGRLFRALESYYEAYKLRPLDMRINFYLARVLAEIGKFNDAFHHIVKAQENEMEGETIMKRFMPSLREFIEKGLETGIHNKYGKTPVY